jgi:hypothetical protein
MVAVALWKLLVFLTEPPAQRIIFVVGSLPGEILDGQLWLPRAHSHGPGEDGEQLPMWVKVFHKYFEEKRVHTVRTEAQEEAQIQIRTIQRTIVPPPESLGSEDAAIALRSEQACSGMMQQSSTIELPYSSWWYFDSGAYYSIWKQLVQKCEKESIKCSRCSCSSIRGLECTMGDFSSLVDHLNMNTCTLMQRPFHKIETDYQQSVANLERATAEGDEHT